MDVPCDHFMAELYGKWLGQNDPLAPHQPAMPFAHYTYLAQEVMQLLALLRSLTPDAPRIRILDYGAGWGHWAQLARSFGAEVVLVELSPAKIAYLQGLGFSVKQFDQLDGESFDFINTEQVIEHLSDPAATVRALMQRLSPHGILKLSVPDGTGIDRVLGSWEWRLTPANRERIMPIQPLEHLNCFTPESLDHFAAQFSLRRIGVPLRMAYAYPADLSGAGGLLKTIVRPVKRFVLKRGCYALYARERS